MCDGGIIVLESVFGFSEPVGMLSTTNRYQVMIITCQHEWVEQCQLRYKVDPPSGYHWEDAHYPTPLCLNGIETKRLWYPDHVVHGALQTLNLQHPCMHGYRVHRERNILKDVYPEYLDIFEKAYALCQKYASNKGCSKGGKVGGIVTKEKGVGIFDPVLRKQYIEKIHTELYVGEKKSQANKKRAQTLGLEKLQSFAQAMNNQRWVSTVDGFESTARGVVEHNKSKGWDPDARVRIS